MKVTFDIWRADEIIQAYIDFIIKKNSEKIFVKYLGEKYGFKETMEGRLDTNDPRIKELPKKIQYVYTRHSLELFQKDWKAEFHLLLFTDNECEYMDKIELTFDSSLRKEVYSYFKEFEPKEIK